MTCWACNGERLVFVEPFSQEVPCSECSSEMTVQEIIAEHHEKERSAIRAHNERIAAMSSQSEEKCNKP